MDETEALVQNELPFDVEVYKEWKRRRQIMTYIGYVQAFMFGIEYTSVSVSGLYYFSENIRPSNPKILYGMSMGFLYLSAIFANPIFGKIMDQTRKLRHLFILTMLGKMIGNFVYTISYAAWIPVFGRMICGLADGCYPIVTGEFRRCYNKTTLPKVLTNYQIMLSLGIMFGPCTPVLFSGVNFYIGSIYINQNNACGFFNAVAFTLLAIVGYVCLVDLSLHPGYEIFKQVDNYDDGVGATTKTISSSSSNMLSLKDLFLYADFMLIVFTSSFSNYISVTVELSAMTTAIYTFKWSMAKLSLVVTLSMVLYLALFLLSRGKVFKSIAITYMTFILSFIIFWIILLVLILPALIPGMFESKVSQYLLIGVVIFCKFFLGISSETSGRCLSFYLVPDHSASFAEGFRNSSSRLFTGVGYLFAAFLYNASIYIYVFPVFCCILFLCAVLLLVRRRVFF